MQVFIVLIVGSMNIFLLLMHTLYVNKINTISNTINSNTNEENNNIQVNDNNTAGSKEAGNLFICVKCDIIKISKINVNIQIRRRNYHER